MHRAILIAFWALLAGGIASNLAQLFMLLEMTEKINRKRNYAQLVDWPNLSFNQLAWTRVLSEYRALYPTGQLSRLLFISIGATVSCWLGVAALLFGVILRR